MDDLPRTASQQLEAELGAGAFMSSPPVLDDLPNLGTNDEEEDDDAIEEDDDAHEEDDDAHDEEAEDHDYIPTAEEIQAELAVVQDDEDDEPAGAGQDATATPVKKKRGRPPTKEKSVERVLMEKIWFPVHV